MAEFRFPVDGAGAQFHYVRRTQISIHYITPAKASLGRAEFAVSDLLTGARVEVELRSELRFLRVRLRIFRMKIA
jgi:hypothetical protein